jgi:hypothetical protein
MLIVIASCTQQHIIYLIVAWWAIIAIPSQLSFVSLRWLTLVVSLFAPSQYDVKNTIVVVVASCNRQFAYRNASPLCPCNTTEKNEYRCRCFLRYNKITLSRAVA